ncbi:ORF6N domain-containing protein [Aquisalimonas lutea]|uniref:ORF6N domain-containing protein n=1 Tax=Aquisalimonas lutea TaxID=1327750 RepID=UPI0025B48AF5|nr:ORF6N domain-containing protein [Aquisalimonas lutea]MDN3516133.1 ORF6N domain-containing protein [Aquisalimonas lutea]
MRFIEYQGHNTLSFRQLDELNGLAKGTTFRLFKRCVDLEEGVDFFYLPAEEHADAIAAWREQGLIYPASVNVVLVTEAGYRKLQQAGG